MDLVKCPKCQGRVLPMSNGNCPSCGEAIAEPYEVKTLPTHPADPGADSEATRSASPRSTQRQATIPTNPEGTIDRTLVGIRGWLLLPAIGLVLSLIIAPIGLIASFAQMTDDYAAYTVPAILVNAGLYVYLWVAAVRFFKKRSEAPQTMIHFLVARIIASVALFVLGLAVLGADDALKIVVLLRANNFVAQGIAAAIWIPYFKVSKRVKVTFVE